MSRLAAPLLAVCLLLGACGDDDDGDDVTLPPLPAEEDDPLGGFDPGDVTWEDCGDGTECGTLTVPLDWSDLDGPTIELALARVPAGEPDRRIGVLATNPGGPGVTGTDFVEGGGGVFAGTVLADRFDIVSWDPRGVGASNPIECDDGIDEAFLRLDPDPDDAGEQAALDDAAESFAVGCGEADGELLAHVGTDDVARDLEAIRRSLALPFAYVGFSYGTLIGLRYAELFPTGAQSIVLDGVVDPEADLAELLRGQTTAFEAVLPRALGDTNELWGEVAAAVENEPIPTTDGRGLKPADLATGTIVAGYSEELWEPLRQGVEDAAAGNGDILLQLADLYRDLGDYDAYQAVSCLDLGHPVGAEAWAAFATELEDISPRYGAAVANEMLPCAFWPVPLRPVTGPVRAAGAPTILVLGTTGDPATPVEQAERVAAALARSHLLVFDGEGHTAYGLSACVNAIVEAYLVQLTLPEAGARC